MDELVWFYGQNGGAGVPLSVCLEDVVISGISGRFPESQSVSEFADNLLNGVDMVTDDGRRFTPGRFSSLLLHTCYLRPPETDLFL